MEPFGIIIPGRLPLANFNEVGEGKWSADIGAVPEQMVTFLTGSQPLPDGTVLAVFMGTSSVDMASRMAMGGNQQQQQSQHQQHDSSPLTTTTTTSHNNNYSSYTNNMAPSSAFPGSSDSLPNVAVSNASSCSLVSPHVSLSYTSFPPEISPDESKTIGIVAAVLASTVGQELLEKIKVLQGSDCSIDSIIDRIEKYQRENLPSTSLDNYDDDELLKAGIVTEGELVRFYTSVTASDLSIMFTMTECHSTDVFEAGKEVGKKIRDVCEGGGVVNINNNILSNPSDWNVVDLTVEMYPFLQLLVWRGACETEKFQAYVVAVGVMDADDKSHKGVSTYIKKERKLREALAAHHTGET
eukprot:GFYU01014054.1.p1 GENE.GFYU01014054.1~~GFYU01014054.1.p1  ORF type:complete len:355 (-),score=35.95 GFYU01014054.1:97-1161(-)